MTVSETAGMREGRHGGQTGAGAHSTAAVGRKVIMRVGAGAEGVVGGGHRGHQGIVGADRGHVAVVGNDGQMGIVVAVVGQNRVVTTSASSAAGRGHEYVVAAGNEGAI